MIMEVGCSSSRLDLDCGCVTYVTFLWKFSDPVFWKKAFTD